MSHEEPNDDGPAFPAMTPGGNYCTPGMSLRDYLAGQAMVAILADPAAFGAPFVFADAAYAYADAMLAARDRDTATAQQIALGIGGGK